MRGLLICVAAILVCGCGTGEEKVKLPDRTYKMPDGDFEPNAKQKERGNDQKEGG